MEKAIKKIEDMSLNAWPSHKMELYDGWILRFPTFTLTEPTAWNSLELPPFHGVKKSPTASSL